MSFEIIALNNFKKSAKAICFEEKIKLRSLDGLLAELQPESGRCR